jgi:FlaA1/EpsC-like NDP-sugar epimerase
VKRSVTRLSQAAIDLAALAAALLLAFAIRFDWSPPPEYVGRLLLVGPYVIVFEYAVLSAFKVPRFSWRYVGLREAGRIFFAVAVASLGLTLSRLVVPQLVEDYPYLRHGLVPFGVILANFVFAFCAVLGVRVARRVIGEKAEKAQHPDTDSKKTKILLIGAGQAGVLVARELAQRPELGLEAVGFADDDPVKKGLEIQGLRVLGPTDELPRICRERGATEILITMANVPGAVVRRVKEKARQAGLPAKIIPGIYEIVGGQVNLSRIREVAIEDLLGREPVDLDLDAIRDFVGDEVVLVTGAGGSIGSEICRQVAAFGPRSLILVERAENALFEIHRELIALHPELTLLPRIADVTDEERVRQIFAQERPTAVFHAAAHKHVPMMEWNAGEAVKNNVGGSRVVADAAHQHGSKSFVMISTDKAVNPTSVMGATKRVAELYVQSLSQRSTTRFVTVRFGNVLGSNGSVIPIFKRQIEAGEPITVTHPDMRRYFMTIPEACQLVLQAGTMGEGGEIFILDMGEPVRIVDLARDLISLSGLQEGDDIEIVFTGTRPGEKLYEELSTSSENASKTRHPKIFVGCFEPVAREEITAQVETLIAHASARAIPEIRDSLRNLVPEYQPSATTKPKEPAEQPLPPLGQSLST